MKRALIVSMLWATAAAAQSVCPTRTMWPDGDGNWPVQLVTGKDAAIAELESYAFTIEGELYGRKGLHTNGLVVIHHGVLVYEKYARGFSAENRHISWSVAKSFSSALIGVAVRDGLLNLDDSICVHLPEYEGTEACGITVKHAITFGTGLDWVEEYENGNYQSSSVLSMLFGVGHADQLKHILTHRFATTPGQQWRYSTGDAALASAVAKRALTTKYGDAPFWPALFDVIGMRDVVVEEDLKGTPLGGSCVYATPREYAKFGYLFLNDGCWQGTRVMPEGWVTASTTPSDVFVTWGDERAQNPSGYSWWLGVPVPERQVPSRWPDVPADTYAAQGHWGQRIIVVPSEDLVVVRVGDDRQTAMNTNDLIKRVLEVVR